MTDRLNGRIPEYSVFSAGRCRYPPPGPPGRAAGTAQWPAENTKGVAAFVLADQSSLQRGQARRWRLQFEVFIDLGKRRSTPKSSWITGYADSREPADRSFRRNYIAYLKFNRRRLRYRDRVKAGLRTLFAVSTPCIPICLIYNDMSVDPSWFERGSARNRFHVIGRLDEEHLGAAGWLVAE